MFDCISIKIKTCLLGTILFIIGIIPAAFFSENEYTHVMMNNDNIKDYRIVCTSPALGEIVYALGLGKEVVGLGEQSMYLANNDEVKNIGKWGSTNLEALVELAPNIIITQGLDDSLGSFCINRDTQVIDLTIQSIDQIYDAIRTIAKVTSESKNGNRLITNIKDKMKAIKQSILFYKPSVFISIARAEGSLSNILTAGRSTFISELLTDAGGENIFSDSKGRWPQISRETLLKRSPDVIIELIPYSCSESEIASYKKDWQQMPELNAVKTGSIYYICSRDVLTPSVHIVDTVEKMHTILDQYESDK